VTILVDTSALLAHLDRADRHHRSAVGWLAGPGHDSGEGLLTHNYVVVESLALAQRRLGPDALRALLEDVLAIVEIVFVDEPTHRAAVGALLASPRRGPSLVDLVSFELMRERGIRAAFAFDQDFRRAGFDTVPQEPQASLANGSAGTLSPGRPSSIGQCG